MRERWESLAALVSVAEDLAAERESGRPRWTCRRSSAELDRRAEAQHVPAAQGVTVGTLHSAKGLEWDAVALLGIHEGSLPFVLATSPEQVGGGAPAALRRGHPGAAAAAGVLVPHPQRRWSRPASRPASSTPVLPAASVGAAASPDAGPRERGTVLSAHCRSCGQPLTDAAERKIGRHTDCPATYDDSTMGLLAEWRRQEAAEQKLPAYCIFTDATLVALAEARPRSASRA